LTRQVLYRCQRFKVRRKRHLSRFHDFAFDLAGEFHTVLVNPMAQERNTETRPSGWVEMFPAIEFDVFRRC
jgi:hypothetical protein